MIVLYIFAVIGVIATAAVLMAVVGNVLAKKPDFPQDLFEDCRGDLRQLQDWYFSNQLYKETESTSQMLKSLDTLWAEWDTKNDNGEDISV